MEGAAAVLEIGVVLVVLGLGVAAGVVSAGQSSAALAAAALTIALSAVGARLFPKTALTVREDGARSGSRR